MSSIFGAIKNAIADAKGSELEKKVRKITSSDNWPVANSTKAEVAVAARSPQGCREVMAIVWEKLDLPSKEWRQIVKTLELLEVMLRLSSERVVDETREYQRGVSRLTDFHYSEDGRDRGAGIREKSQYIMKLLSDQQLLKEVRAQAKENQQKCVAISSDGSARNTGAYDAYSYNDDHYESAFANGGYDTPAPKPKAQAQGAAQAGGAHKSPAVVKKAAPQKAAPPPKQVSDGEEESDGEDEDEAEQQRAKAKAAAKKAAAKPKAKKIAVEMDGDEPVAAPAAAKRAAPPVQQAVPAVQPQVPASSQPASLNWDDMGASLPAQPAAAPVRAAAPTSDGFDMFDPRAPVAAPVAAQPVASRQPAAAVEWDPFTGAAAAPAAPAPKQPMQIPVDLFDRPAVPASAPAAAGAAGDIDFGDFKSAEAPKKPAAPADALWGSSLVGGGTFSLTNAPAAAPKPTGPAKPSMSAMRATGPTAGAAGSAGAGAGGGVGDFFFSGPAAAVAPLYPTAPVQPVARQPQYPNAGAGYPPMGMGMGMTMGMGMGMGMGMQPQPMGMNPYAAQAQMPMVPALLPVRQPQPQPAAANSAAFFFN